jgi:hypothetical protein
LRAAQPLTPILLDLGRIRILTRDQAWATELLRGLVRFSDEWPA